MNIDDRLRALTERLLRLGEAIEADQQRLFGAVTQPTQLVAESQLVAERIADRERIQALLRLAESRLSR